MKVKVLIKVSLQEIRSYQHMQARSESGKVAAAFCETREAFDGSRDGLRVYCMMVCQVP